MATGGFDPSDPPLPPEDGRHCVPRDPVGDQQTNDHHQSNRSVPPDVRNDRNIAKPAARRISARGRARALALARTELHQNQAGTGPVRRGAEDRHGGGANRPRPRDVPGAVGNQPQAQPGPSRDVAGAERKHAEQARPEPNNRDRRERQRRARRRREEKEREQQIRRGHDAVHGDAHRHGELARNGRNRLRNNREAANQQQAPDDGQQYCQPEQQPYNNQDPDYGPHAEAAHFEDEDMDTYDEFQPPASSGYFPMVPHSLHTTQNFGQPAMSMPPSSFEPTMYGGQSHPVTSFDVPDGMYYFSQSQSPQAHANPGSTRYPYQEAVPNFYPQYGNMYPYRMQGYPGQDLPNAIGMPQASGSGPPTGLFQVPGRGNPARLSQTGGLNSDHPEVPHYPAETGLPREAAPPKGALPAAGPGSQAQRPPRHPNKRNHRQRNDGQRQGTPNARPAAERRHVSRQLSEEQPQPVSSSTQPESLAQAREAEDQAAIRSPAHQSTSQSNVPSQEAYEAHIQAQAQIPPDQPGRAIRGRVDDGQCSASGAHGHYSAHGHQTQGVLNNKQASSKSKRQNPAPQGDQQEQGAEALSAQASNNPSNPPSLADAAARQVVPPPERAEGSSGFVFTRKRDRPKPEREIPNSNSPVANVGRYSLDEDEQGRPYTGSLVPCDMCDREHPTFYPRNCHRLCAPCMYMFASLNGGHFFCPVCDCYMYVPWTWIMNPENERPKDDISTGEGSRKCGMCEHYDPNQPPQYAEHYCYQCVEALCTDCKYRVHVGRRKRLHVIQPLAPESWLEQKRAMQEERKPLHCNMHAEQPLSVFCRDCRISVCELCVDDNGHTDHALWNLTVTVKNARNTLNTALVKLEVHRDVMDRVMDELDVLVNVMRVAQEPLGDPSIARTYNDTDCEKIFMKVHIMEIYLDHLRGLLNESDLCVFNMTTWIYSRPLLSDEVCYFWNRVFPDHDPVHAGDKERQDQILTAQALIRLPKEMGKIYFVRGQPVFKLAPDVTHRPVGKGAIFTANGRDFAILGPPAKNSSLAPRRPPPIQSRGSMNVHAHDSGNIVGGERSVSTLACSSSSSAEGVADAATGECVGEPHAVLSTATPHRSTIGLNSVVSTEAPSASALGLNTIVSNEASNSSVSTEELHELQGVNTLAFEAVAGARETEGSCRVFPSDTSSSESSQSREPKESPESRHLWSSDEERLPEPDLAPQAEPDSLPRCPDLHDSSTSVSLLDEATGEEESERRSEQAGATRDGIVDSASSQVTSSQETSEQQPMGGGNVHDAAIQRRENRDISEEQWGEAPGGNGASSSSAGTSVSQDKTLT